MTDEIGNHVARALRSAAQRVATMDVCIVVDVNEGFERHPEPFAIIQQRAVMIRNAPRTGVEIESGIEFAALLRATQFREAITASQRPAAAAGALFVFEQLYAIAGLVEFIGRDESRKAGAEDEHRRTLRVAIESDRSGIIGRSEEHTS